jgi:hypothetical protein
VLRRRLLRALRARCEEIRLLDNSHVGKKLRRRASRGAR